MEEESKVVVIKHPKTGEEVSYFMQPRLKKMLDTKVKPVLESGKDDDYILALDGKERSGKSTLGFQIAKYVDPSFDLSRVVFTAEEFRDAIFKAKKGQAIVYDEAFSGLSSRASLSGVNKYLVSLMMQMGQKNLFVIIILPTFFLLEKYVALWRARRLIHVYRSRKTSRRGYFRVYNSKKKLALYLGGKQTYSYDVKEAYTKFKGRFYGTFAITGQGMEDKYRKKKEKALEDTEKNPMKVGEIKYRDQRDVFIHLLRKHTGMTLKEMSNLIADYNIEISFKQIANICAKFGDALAKKQVKEDKKEEQESEQEEEKEIEIKEQEDIEEDNSLLEGTAFEKDEDE